jgi:hypothetical protein
MKRKRDPAISLLVTETKAAAARMTPTRKRMLDAHVQTVLTPDVLQLIEEMAPLANDATESEREFNHVVRQSMKVGFVLAVVRYNRELKCNAEALRILTSRAAGAESGRETSSRLRDAKYQKIREKWAAMEAAGIKVTNEVLVAAMRQDGVKVSIRTVQRAFESKAVKRTRT